MKFKDKNDLRKYMWDLLKDTNISKRAKGDHGRIPDFKGSDDAANLLSMTIEWDKSQIVFCSPDSAQRKIRELALRDEKSLIMPSPKLKNGYLLINPKTLAGHIKEASSIKGAFRFGSKIEKFPKVDMVVEGSVAVDRNGNRLGKGGGYGDREIKELFEQKAISNTTPLVTTVHDVQIRECVPIEVHDEKINMIVTPRKILRLFQNQDIPIVR